MLLASVFVVELDGFRGDLAVRLGSPESEFRNPGLLPFSTASFLLDPLFNADWSRPLV